MLSASTKRKASNSWETDGTGKVPNGCLDVAPYGMAAHLSKQAGSINADRTHKPEPRRIVAPGSQQVGADSPTSPINARRDP